MPTKNVFEKPDVKLVEEMLLRAVTDIEFRRELLTKPEMFSDYTVFERLADVDDKIVESSTEVQPFMLPESVAPQDMSFLELINDTTSIEACASTCLTGLTLRCDGHSIEDSSGCRCTCISGWTVSCDGRSL